jgi:CRP-like cAMP-binding protein
MAVDEVALELFPELDGVELIQKVDLFHALNYEETLAVASIARVERFAPGAMMIEQASIGSALFILRAGEVAVSRVNSRGDDEPLARLGPGSLVGEMALIESDLASANVRAVSEVEALVIPREAFEKLLEKDKGLALRVYRAFCKSLSERLRMTTIKLSEKR